MTTNKWADLHDAVLESLEIRSTQAEGVVYLYGARIDARAIRRVECPRLLPWAFSKHINGVVESNTGDGTSTLEIEMQSGDVIRIEADAFQLSGLVPADASRLPLRKEPT